MAASPGFRDAGTYVPVLLQGRQGLRGSQKRPRAGSVERKSEL